MKHMTRDEAVCRHLLQRARTVAVIGASANPARHSDMVAQYLKGAGYDVIPIGPGAETVAGVIGYATLADVPAQVDLVVIFRQPRAVPAHIAEAAAKRVQAVWLQPGTWSPQAEAAAERLGLTLVKERCIAETHRHLVEQSGHPAKWGVHVRRRKPTYEDNRRRPETSGYAQEGGGGRVAGGGVRAVLDEKKMVKGAPSRRSGPFKPRPK